MFQKQPIYCSLLRYTDMRPICDNCLHVLFNELPKALKMVSEISHVLTVR